MMTDNVLRSLEYRPERDDELHDEGLYDKSREEELREAIEAGRRYKIAGEVWREFLTNRREEIIRDLEYGHYKGMNEEMLNEELAELRILRKYQDVGNMMIDAGVLAEREMRINGE